MSTFSIFVALIILVCFLLVLVIMVQNPKGGGLSSSFGGGTQQMGGVQKTSDFLDRSTWILATLLLALILVSNITLSSGNDVLDSKLLEDSSTPENFDNPIEQPIQEIPEADTNQNPTLEIPEAGN
ncbi:MAG: preprotein translocase subunit SecG [Flavobacteriaceae bacterium]|tara:strand:- start:762 stop:1139 length:378 start_codon:yes stop_codon:yes gene_type:complete